MYLIRLLWVCYISALYVVFFSFIIFFCQNKVIIMLHMPLVSIFREKCIISSFLNLLKEFKDKLIYNKLGY